MEHKIRISSVSYTNMAPFIYGLTHHPIITEIDLSLDVPAECARKLKNGLADVGIVPVGALLEMPAYEIISDYCLGANGPVDSVFIFSSKPIEDIQSLRMDDQSRSSNGLARLLLKEYWKREHVDFLTNGEAEADAFVQIGDRTFGQKNRYAYVYDLAEHWKIHTGLPFAFAVWISVRKLSQDFVRKFNAALKFGLDNRDTVIAELPPRADFDFGPYLRVNIDYPFDVGKQEAVQMYLNWLRENPMP